jgi:hypothetical protein
MARSLPNRCPETSFCGGDFLFPSKRQTPIWQPHDVVRPFRKLCADISFSLPQSHLQSQNTDVPFSLRLPVGFIATSIPNLCPVKSIILDSFNHPFNQPSEERNCSSGGFFVVYLVITSVNLVFCAI